MNYMLVALLSLMFASTAFADGSEHHHGGIGRCGALANRGRRHHAQNVDKPVG